ncbi:MAG: alpha/beta hydrolase, partial [Paraburkholderia fungorum]
MKMLPHVASVLSLSACLFALTGAMAQDTSAAPAANGNGPVKNIVLVHGAWVDGSGWRPVYDI